MPRIRRRFSPTILQGLLREELGFDGVIVTDALDMAGASGVHGIPEAAVRALAAGCDLLCIGTDNTDDAARRDRGGRRGRDRGGTAPRRARSTMPPPAYADSLRAPPAVPTGAAAPRAIEPHHDAADVARIVGAFEVSDVARSRLARASRRRGRARSTPSRTSRRRRALGSVRAEAARDVTRGSPVPVIANGDRTARRAGAGRRRRDRRRRARDRHATTTGTTSRAHAIDAAARRARRRRRVSTWAGRRTTAHTPTSRPSGRPASRSAAGARAAGSGGRRRSNGTSTGRGVRRRHRHRRHQDRGRRASTTRATCSEQRAHAHRLRAATRSSRPRSHASRGSPSRSRRRRHPRSLDRHRHPRRRRQRHRARLARREPRPRGTRARRRDSPTRLGVAVRVENDVKAAALGAFHLLEQPATASDGLPEPRHRTRGRPRAATASCWRGGRGVAGEIGHIPVDPARDRCELRPARLPRDVASGSAIARQWPSGEPSMPCPRSVRCGRRRGRARDRDAPTASSRASRPPCACSCSPSTSTASSSAADSPRSASRCSTASRRDPEPSGPPSRRSSPRSTSPLACGHAPRIPGAAVGAALVGADHMAEVVSRRRVRLPPAQLVADAIVSRRSRRSPTPCSASRPGRRRSRPTRRSRSASRLTARPVAACADSRSTSTSGLPVGHPESYRSVITREVVEPLGLTPVARARSERRRGGRIEDAGDRLRGGDHAAGGIDLQILGIGRTGHIGFNEPGSSLASLTRVKTLTEQTRVDNARFFDSTRRRARRTASRRDSARSCAPGTSCCSPSARPRRRRSPRRVEGPVSANQPGSAIQLHPRVTVIVDEAAASQLAARSTTTGTPGRTSRHGRASDELSGHRAEVTGARRPGHPLGSFSGGASRGSRRCTRPRRTRGRPRAGS